MASAQKRSIRIEGTGRGAVNPYYGSNRSSRHIAGDRGHHRSSRSLCTVVNESCAMYREVIPRTRGRKAREVPFAGGRRCVHAALAVMQVADNLWTAQLPDNVRFFAISAVRFFSFGGTSRRQTWLPRECGCGGAGARTDLTILHLAGTKTYILTT